MEKPFSDYKWDPDHPGSMPPGIAREMYEIEDVEAMWEGRDNPACTEYPSDQYIEDPRKPPEDMLAWLDRIGMLSERVPPCFLNPSELH